jgi:hypothetical protein
MPPSVRPRAGWFRRSLREGGAAALLLAAAGCTWSFGGDLELAQQVVLGAVLLLGLAVVLRRGWLRLFGPVLAYEFVRTVRRGRYVALRSVYACTLLLVVFGAYLSFKGQVAEAGGPVTAGALSRFAGSLFFTFMAVQFAAALLLTPAYVAGAVAEEKDRRTLEFLLATDLRSREIVLGKLTVHLGNLVLLILTGLPILSLTQAGGGVGELWTRISNPRWGVDNWIYAASGAGSRPRTNLCYPSVPPLRRRSRRRSVSRRASPAGTIRSWRNPDPVNTATCVSLGKVPKVRESCWSWLTTARGRLYCGANTIGWKAVHVARDVPREWMVVTVDLWQRFGPLTLTGKVGVCGIS